MKLDRRKVLQNWTRCSVRKDEIMNALVTGGAGFIGSHLCETLLGRGGRIVCLDNLTLGSLSNIEGLLGDSRFTFMEMDVSDVERLDAVFAESRFDGVFHLAANSDIQASSENPRVEYSLTYSTTFAVLECMRRHRVKQLFFASTGAVYGDKDGASVDESGWALEPISYYGAAKLGAEALISAYTHMNGLASLVFRFPNVIGPRLTHGVIFDFMRRLRADPTRLRILGDGNQAKPYMHVSDLIGGIMRFLGDGVGVSQYNIGVDDQISVTRIADIVCEEMGIHGARYEYTGGKGGWPGDIPIFSYDLGKIHKAGWKSALNSEQAVRKTVREELRRL